MKKNLLITGGAGFIGSHLAELLTLKYPHYHCIVLDALTYAGHIQHLNSVIDCSNFTFIQGDIQDKPLLQTIFKRYAIAGVFHLAAQTHVDHSIKEPMPFAQTNVLGTCTLLEVCLTYLKENPKNFRFLHVSSDEVFGSIEQPLIAKEDCPYHPSSPYSASKAGADHFVQAYIHTYDFPAIISYCSNNFGPRQYPEKLIPHAIYQALHQSPIPLYGNGLQVRDWIGVEDHINALDLLFHHGQLGSRYNISAGQERTNLSVVQTLCRQLEEKLSYPPLTLNKLIQFTLDRPGHDERYALDATRLKSELNWQPQHDFEVYLSTTIDWYIKNENVFRL